MLQLNTKTFNPEILYVFDYENIGPTTNKHHCHDFLELSIVLDGSVDYVIGDQKTRIPEKTLLLFNPGVYHHESYETGMSATQLHIGFRNLTLHGVPRDRFPFTSSIIKLTDFEAQFFDVCKAILLEKATAYPGYDLMIKALVMKLIVLILRDSATSQLETNALKLSYEAQEKQVMIEHIIDYLEAHHDEEVSLSTLSQSLYMSPTYISRVFKEETGESPINYLIKIRLARAKALLKSNANVTVKEAANQVGYSDAFYFSKLFKKYYGKSPSTLLRRHK